jgi:hypothetical protein
MPSGLRPEHPQAVHRDPLNTLAGTLADPGTKPGVRVKPEVAALLARGQRRTHSRLGCWPRRTPQPLGRSDDQGLGQGLHRFEGQPGSGG